MRALPGPLVSTDWLAEHLDDPVLRVFDCSVSLVPADGGMRIESGRAAWEAGHIPGSGFLDLPGALSDATQPLPLMMPGAPQFAAVMGGHGVGPGDFVVLYDSGPHTWATRAWWMLRAMGFDAAAVLDGGIAKWRAEGRPLSSAPCRYAPVPFEARPREGVFVDKAQVALAHADPGVRLLNALSADEHAGRVSRLPRAGRIPGSGNVPAGSLIDPATGAFLPLPQLRERFAAQQALDGRPVVTYCGGGIAATCAAFSLLRLGVEDVAVYDGSLSEWSRDPALPLETD